MHLDLGDGETVVVITAGTATDPYSHQPAESWADDDVTSRTVRLIAPAEPRPSDEPTQAARNAVTSGWTLYLPAGDPIARTDRVQVRDQTYPVQGEPARWAHSTVVQAFGTIG